MNDETLNHQELWSVHISVTPGISLISADFWDSYNVFFTRYHIFIELFTWTPTHRFRSSAINVLAEMADVVSEGSGVVSFYYTQEYNISDILLLYQ